MACRDDTRAHAMIGRLFRALPFLGIRIGGFGLFGWGVDGTLGANRRGCSVQIIRNVPRSDTPQVRNFRSPGAGHETESPFNIEKCQKKPSNVDCPAAIPAGRHHRAGKSAIFPKRVFAGRFSVQVASHQGEHRQLAQVEST